MTNFPNQLPTREALIPHERRLTDCPVCGHAPHARACRVRMNVGTIHEVNCGCNGPGTDVAEG